MIVLEHIHKHYTTPKGTVQALRDVNLQVAPREIFGVMGKSGAGKSSLIRCINLLETPASGKIIVGGEELTALSPMKLRAARRKIGMIFQHFNLLASRNVYDNIALPLELAGYTRKQIAETISPLLELTQLKDKKSAYPSQLSGGQKQRVAIARALASKPQVLLSDEATSALDPETTLSILNLLKNIRDTLNLTILLITHEVNVVKTICDRVAILEEGVLVEENTVGEFFAHPRTDIARNFIASSVLQHLPMAIKQHLLVFEQADTHPVLRLWFLQGTATQPIISEISRRFHLHINILQANVEYIKNHVMGIMMVTLKGDTSTIQPAINYLKQRNVQVEVMGYVPNDIIF
ncbi:MAG: metN [Gammaproteobacteria bacterium]|nr:metN [Gammaproteobacteria bacterium]